MKLWRRGLLWTIFLFHLFGFCGLEASLENLFSSLLYSNIVDEGLPYIMFSLLKYEFDILKHGKKLLFLSILRVFISVSC